MTRSETQIGAANKNDALGAVTRHGGGLRKLEAGCMATNAAMRRVFFHAGFQFEGEKKNDFLWNGQLTGAVYYGKFR